MSDAVMAPGELTLDGTATVLLCVAIEGRRAAGGPRPLTIREYQGLALWLHQRGLTPGVLLGAGGARSLPETVPDGPTRERVETLLSRGFSLSVLLEKWAARGIRAVTRSDATYPQRLVNRLKAQRPPVLFVAGDIALAGRRSIAVVGSRDADEAALDLTTKIGRWAAEKGIAVVSGGARGIDSAAVLSALEAGGSAVGVLADSLSRAVLDGKYREAIAEGRLLLATPYSPDAGFNVGNAMGRNKLVYALSDAAVVVSSAEGSGGTWAGATEALRAKWVPVFADSRESAPRGNRSLLALGARVFTFEDLERAVGVYETATRTATRVAEPGSPVPPPPAPRVFDLVWPLLARLLEEPIAAAAAARSLDVRVEQALDWLRLAEGEGLVLKVARKWRRSEVARTDRVSPAPDGSKVALDLLSPMLRGAIERGTGKREIARELGVRPGQLEDWLAQMGGTPGVRTRRNRAGQAARQPGLFD